MLHAISQVIHSLPLRDFTEFAHIDEASAPQLWALLGGFLCKAPVFMYYREKHGLFKDPASAPLDLQQWSWVNHGELNLSIPHCEDVLERCVGGR